MLATTKNRWDEKSRSLSENTPISPSAWIPPPALYTTVCSLCGESDVGNVLETNIHNELCLSARGRYTHLMLTYRAVKGVVLSWKHLVYNHYTSFNGSRIQWMYRSVSEGQGRDTGQAGQHPNGSFRRTTDGYHGVPTGYGPGSHRICLWVQELSKYGYPSKDYCVEKKPFKTR